MPDAINIPGLGSVPKKYAIGGVVAGAGIAAVVYVRSKKTAAAAATAATDTTGTSSDTSGYYDSTIDPNTGIPYAEESGYGSDYGGGAYGAYGGNTDAAGYPIGSAADLAWSQQQNTGISTNSDWVQEAMAGAVPGDPGTIQAALGGVLGGLTVTNAQRDLFLEAVGVLGEPPQGYPQPIHTSDTAGQPGTPAPAPAQVKVPYVIGQNLNKAIASIENAGLKEHTLTKAAYGNPGAWKVIGQNPSGGTVAKGATIMISAGKL